MRRLNPVRHFLLVSGAPVAALCLALALAISHLLERHMMQVEWLSTADLVKREVAEGGLAPYFTDPQFRREPARYGEAFKGLLSLPEVVRIKVWDREATVLWSDEARLIGKRFPQNREVREALSGRLSAALKTLHKEEQEYERERFTRLAGVYVPITAQGSGEIIGIVEVYKPLARLLAGIRRVQVVVWGIAFAGGILLCLLLRPVLRRSYEKPLELEARARERARELSALFETARHAVSALSLDEILPIVVRSAADLLNCRASSLRLVDRKTKL